MTITNQNAISGPYYGNGVTTVFGYTFDAGVAAEVVVKKRGTNMVETVLALTTNYTVDLNAKQITTVGAGSPIATGEVLTIERSNARTFASTLNATSGWLPSDHQEYLEKLTKLAQEVEMLAKRSGVGLSTSGMSAESIARQSMVLIRETVIGAPVVGVDFAPLGIRHYLGIRVEVVGLQCDADDSAGLLYLRHAASATWATFLRADGVGHSVVPGGALVEPIVASVLLPLSATTATRRLGFEAGAAKESLDCVVDIARTHGTDELERALVSVRSHYVSPSGAALYTCTARLSTTAPGTEWDGVRIGAGSANLIAGTVRIYARVA